LLQFLTLQREVSLTSQYLLCIRNLTDDGLSGQSKHFAVYNERLLYELYMLYLVG